MTVMDVACAAEGRDYVAHSAAMLHSLLQKHPEDDVRIHYLHGPEVRAGHRRRLAQMVDAAGGEIAFYDIPDQRVAGLPTRGFTRKATWYRIFLPELCPDVERTLYLDSDLLVVDDLTPLWELDLGESYVAAVTNILEPQYEHRPAELGLRPRSYFNAGVVMMNLDQMRRDDRGPALLEFGVRNAEKLLWRDQDALNVVLGERRIELHPRWNCMNIFFWLPRSEEVFGRERLEEARLDPAIRHFEGPAENKPWHLNCTGSYRRDYLQHRRQTPWPRVRRTGVTPANIMRYARRRFGRALNATG
jgi:lipopolysaccharide biosynthesis glycosyltransferase